MTCERCGSSANGRLCAGCRQDQGNLKAHGVPEDRLSDEDWIIVSSHAYDRWDQRTDAPGIGPRIAWREGQRIQSDALEGDEFRYHRDTGTVLVRKNAVLVTVIAAASAAPPVRRSIEAATEGSA